VEKRKKRGEKTKGKKRPIKRHLTQHKSVYNAPPRLEGKGKGGATGREVAQKKKKKKQGEGEGRRRSRGILEKGSDSRE